MDAPGAKQAGDLYYIDRQLAGPLHRFEPAPLPEQTKFLQDMEAALEETLNAFWRMVIDHTMQDFYRSPAHGGNRDVASWECWGSAT